MSMRSAQGSYIYDTDGKVWLDMLSGILNVSLGHGHYAVEGALYEVASAGLVNSYDRKSRNHDALVELLREFRRGYEWRLLNTGAEAIERAIQIAAHYKGVPITELRIAVLHDCFHGKSISMAGLKYDIDIPLNVKRIDYTSLDFDVLIYEPVQGEYGFVPSESRLRAMCDEAGAVLIADEMITGFYRCGNRFLSKDADIIVSGKGLAQGAPLTVIGVKDHIACSVQPAVGWNTTGGGNNLCATIGLRVLEFLMNNEDQIVALTAQIERSLASLGFIAWGALGFMRHDSEVRRTIVEQEGVILSWHDPVIRIGPQFYVHDNEFTRLCDVLEQARK